MTEWSKVLVSKTRFRGFESYCSCKNVSQSVPFAFGNGFRIEKMIFEIVADCRKGELLQEIGSISRMYCSECHTFLACCVCFSLQDAVRLSYFAPRTG